MKLTVVIGASPDPSRTSYQAVERMFSRGIPVKAVGIREGKIGEVPIHNDRPHFGEVDTITLYVGPGNQPSWYDYILSLKPKRIIFNPGAENEELEKMAGKNGIEVLEACTLVMLSAGTY